jgi:Leucine-rich repeat (LRR) protein
MAELAPLAELQTLELSANQLHSVDCASLIALEELWLSSNPILDAAGIAQLGNLPKLKTVYLDGCPISKNGAYRETVLGLVPALQQLDADVLGCAGGSPGSACGTRSRDTQGEDAGAACKRQATG